MQAQESEGIAEIPVPKQKPVAPEKNEIPVPEEKPKYSVKAPTKISTIAYEIPQARAIKLSKKSLSKKQAALYREIFDLQAKGKMKESAEKIKRLSDFRLYGYVLHQRYTHALQSPPPFENLRRWLTHYADHPNAKDIYGMALQAKPENYKGAVKAPLSLPYIARRHEPAMIKVAHYKSSQKRSDEEIVQVRGLKTDIKSLVLRERPTQAIAMLEQSPYRRQLDKTEYDMLRARIAASYLYNGKTEKALKHAAASVERSGAKAPLAGWVAGLASWIKEDYTKAAKYFAITGQSDYATGWTKSAGAYWAARSYERLGNKKKADTWLVHAAEYPRTFYGLIAARALGRDFDFNWKIPPFTKKNDKRLASTPAGFRAMALVASGQNALAQKELLRIDVSDRAMHEAVLSYADYADLPTLMMRLGNVNGEQYDGALYPLSPWKPRDGYKIDKALLYAIMRQESRFNPTAASPSGARGLIQILPSTARSVGLKNINDLENPEINLELGQRYIAKLLREKSVQGDLFKLMMAYNAGPGNLKKWLSRVPETQDPLLFVELIPSAETRAYVERVLANYWIYSLQDSHKITTLEAVVAGNSVKYEPSKRKWTWKTALAAD